MVHSFPLADERGMCRYKILENACHIPKRLRGVFTTRRYTNPRLPLPYVLYTAELEQLTLRHSLHIHQCADDSQVYISVAVNDVRVAVHTRCLRP